MHVTYICNVYTYVQYTVCLHTFTCILMYINVRIYVCMYEFVHVHYTVCYVCIHLHVSILMLGCVLIPILLKSKVYVCIHSCMC